MGGIDSTADIYRKVDANMQSRSMISDQAAELLGEDYSQGSVFDSNNLNVSDRYNVMRGALRDRAEITRAGASIARDDLTTEQAGRELEALESEDEVLQQISALDPMSDNFEEDVADYLPITAQLNSARELMGMQFAKRERNLGALNSIMDSASQSGLSGQQLQDTFNVASDMARNNNLTGLQMLDAQHKRNAVRIKSRNRLSGTKTRAASGIENEIAKTGIQGSGKVYLANQIKDSVGFWGRDEGGVPVAPSGMSPRITELLVNNDFAGLAELASNAVRNPIHSHDVDSFVAQFMDSDELTEDSKQAEQFLKGLYKTATASVQHDTLSAALAAETGVAPGTSQVPSKGGGSRKRWSSASIKDMGAELEAKFKATKAGN